MLDFYEKNKFICLVWLFLALTCLATLFQGKSETAFVTGLATAIVGSYLWHMSQKEKER
jgi:hypothetical protein